MIEVNELYLKIIGYYKFLRFRSTLGIDLRLVFRLDWV
jgi:hypothetical protein